jgi:hypothetical protein
MSTHQLKNVLAGFAMLALSSCATVIPLPTWNASGAALEAEYEPYMQQGTSQIVGQAFFAQRGGGTVKAAGRNVTLDPATTIGNEWWGKAGKVWVHRELMPPSPGFVKARRTVVADAEGRFSFKEIPAGKYYVRTEVTWWAGSLQGGLVGQPIEVAPDETKEVILNQFPQ